jgi:hypothetical protein
MVSILSLYPGFSFLLSNSSGAPFVPPAAGGKKEEEARTPRAPAPHFPGGINDELEGSSALSPM